VKPEPVKPEPVQPEPPEPALPLPKSDELGPPVPEPPARLDQEPAKPAAPPRPEDENLFEAGKGWRARRAFAVGAAAQGATDPDAAAITPATHAAPTGPRAVPRVPFDPAAESRRLRGGR